jgi:hypothetical protein
MNKDKKVESTEKRLSFVIFYLNNSLIILDCNCMITILRIRYYYSTNNLMTFTVYIVL